MAFQTNGVDFSSGLVPKSYLFDVYPSLSNVITAPALWGWGNNSNGQLGDNTSTYRSSPVQTVAGGTNWKQVSGGAYHTAAIKTDGTLWGWGNNGNGQLGDNSTTNNSSPVQTVAGGTNWKQVSCGEYHTAAIKADGTLWCWGRNSEGQLGNNTLTMRSSPIQTITGGTNWKQVSCGQYHTAAVKTDGTLWLWGYNAEGELSDNTNTNRSSPVQTIAGGTNWTLVACGSRHVSAIKTDGTLWGWGRDDYGQLGDNTTTHKSSPVQTVAGGTNWKQVSCGYVHTAAIKTDGTLWGWGVDRFGQLGDNTANINRSSPVQTITGGTNWKQVSCGYSTAAIKTDGTLWTWGYNYHGQLGNNTTTNGSSPSQTVVSGTNWKQVSCGRFNTTAIADSSLYSDSNPLPIITTIVISGTASVIVNSAYTYTVLLTYNTGATSTDTTKLNWSTSNGRASLTSNTGTASTMYMNFAGTDTIIATDPNSGRSATFAITVADVTGTSLLTWGLNTNGELGDGTTTNKSIPTYISASSNNWTVTSSNNSHSAGIKTDGTLWMWGYNLYGQVGDNTITAKSSPVQTSAGGTNWKLVSCGLDFTSAIKSDGTLWSWGNNGNGQLGDNTITSKSSPVQTTAGGTNWKQVSCGYSHTAAVKTNGTLWMWGNNGYGQLGDNSITAKSSPVQTSAGGTNWMQVSSGGYYTSAIKTDGTLWVWGQDTYGMLGDNSTAHKSNPVQTTAGGNNWTQVSCGNYHTSAIKADGTLWTWGRDVYGQLGDGTTTNRSSPVQTIAGGTNWNQVSCGVFSTAAIKSDGSLWGWGRNLEGQLGDGTTVHKSSPVQTIAGGYSWVTVACGKHIVATCGYTNGKLWMCGYNKYGQLGDNTSTYRSSPVQTIAGGTNWKQGSGGYFHTVSIKTDGTLWAWGSNTTGAIGDNTGTNKSSPVQVYGGGTNWLYAAAGYYHTVSIKTDGTLWGWGSNSNGQLGTNNTTSTSSPIQTVTGGTNWKGVACGLFHTAAIKTDGTLWGWGNNGNGRLGDYTTVDKSSPVQVYGGGNNWKQVACGYKHSTAIKTDGTLWCWGWGGMGQLGDNTGSDTSSPVQTVTGGKNWKQVACGYYHTVSIKTDGTLWGWGNNGTGQLGDNTTVLRTSPIQTITGGTNWMMVACGNAYSIAIKTDGTLWGWGANDYGVLGDNSTVSKSSPVQTVAGGTNWTYVACSTNGVLAISS